MLVFVINCVSCHRDTLETQKLCYLIVLMHMKVSHVGDFCKLSTEYRVFQKILQKSEPWVVF
jgi:hypothetical protein